MRTRRRYVLLLALLVLVLLTLACNDWDGMDRSDWGTPTPQATLVTGREHGRY
jgi:hypothetical protein